MIVYEYTYLFIDWRTGVAEVRRSRRLVISFVCTIANYDYGFAYHLYLDGTIEGNVKLTGITSMELLILLYYKCSKVQLY